MTLDEAQRVADVASEADGGCPTCASALAKLLQKEFPEFEWRFMGDVEPYSLRIEVKVGQGG